VVRKAIQGKASVDRILIHLVDVRKAAKEHEGVSELGDEAGDTRLLPSQKRPEDYVALSDFDGW